MATVKEWEAMLREMSPETRQDMKNHLLGLKNIIMFHNEFKDTGIFGLIVSIDYVELESQKEEGGKN